MFFSAEEYLYGYKLCNWQNGKGEITAEKGRPYRNRKGEHYNARPCKLKKAETEANKGFQYEIKTVL